MKQKRKAIIVSADGVFARMLCLELEELGYDAGVTADLTEADDGKIIVLDEDTADGSEVSAFVRISYDYEEKIIKKDRCFCLRRPIDVSIFRSLFTREADEADNVPYGEEENSRSVEVINHCAVYGGMTFPLSEREEELLKLLLSRKGEAVSRDEACRIIWGKDSYTNVVDVYIRYLRAKLESENNNSKRIIYTVRGKGYMIK